MVKPSEEKGEGRRFDVVLLDLDGTVYQHGQAISGAQSAIEMLIAQGIAVRFVTNTTMATCADIAQRLRHMRIDVPDEWISTPAKVARAWLAQEMPGAKVFPLVTRALRKDLTGIELVDEPPAQVVLVGDMIDEWDVRYLHYGLRCLVSGAKLFALQRGRYWVAPDGLRLDAGAFVAALSFASCVPCDVNFGKPSRPFFEMAYAGLTNEAGTVCMVGDDIESDVQGARAAGITGILVRTGKGATIKQEMVTGLADYVIGSIAHLPGIVIAAE